jgi:hypothetical protein
MPMHGTHIRQSTARAADVVDATAGAVAMGPPESDYLVIG